MASCQRLYYPNGKTKCEFHMKKGNFHRTDGPAITEYYKNGKVKSRKWYLDGNLHRNKKPAVTHYYKNGRIREKQYFKNNLKHNTNDAAHYIWYENGQLNFKIYFYEGQYHRSNGPAIQMWNENGQILIEEYFVNGKLHRESGPSVIHWNDDGNLICEEFWENNRLEKRNGVGFRYWYLEEEDVQEGVDFYRHRKTELIRSLYIAINQTSKLNKTQIFLLENYIEKTIYVYEHSVNYDATRQLCYKALAIIRNRKKELVKTPTIPMTQNKIPEKIYDTDKLILKTGFTLSSITAVLDSFWIISEGKINNPVSAFNTEDVIQIDMKPLKTKFTQSQISKDGKYYHAIVTTISNETFDLSLTDKSDHVWLYMLQCYLRLIIADAVAPRVGVYVSQKQNKISFDESGKAILSQKNRVEYYPKAKNIVVPNNIENKADLTTNNKQNTVLITGRYRKHFNNPDYVPNPEVVERAAREGMLPIPVGYTFVRTHYRGDKSKYNPQHVVYITPLCEMMEETIKKMLN